MINSALSYTSRDFNSIYEDLVNAIPSLTKLWTSKDENDPGIVLVKLIASLGDNLSYYLDKTALELYPDSVTQRKNAQKIFKLIGYKMMGYVSAQTTVTITNKLLDGMTTERIEEAGKSSNVYISQYSVLKTKDGANSYIIMDSGVIPAGDAGSTTNKKTFRAVEGVMASETFSGSTVNSKNRYYLGCSYIDEANIMLSDSFNNQWKLVSDVSLFADGTRAFCMNYDEYDLPYIELVPYWSSYVGDNDPSSITFTVTYIKSKGSKGAIGKNMLSTKFTRGTPVTYGTELIVENTPSIYGTDPETPDEARLSYSNYVNCLDTAVTCEDMSKLLSRHNSVANCVVLDAEDDPTINPSLVGSDMISQDEQLESSRSPYTYKIYMTKEFNYDNRSVDSTNPSEDSHNFDLIDSPSSIFNGKYVISRDSESYQTEYSVLIDELYSYINDYRVASKQMYGLEGTDYLYRSAPIYADWDADISIIPKYQLSETEANNLRLVVMKALQKDFSLSRVKFGTPVEYAEVVRSAMNADTSMILNAYVGPISKSYDNANELISDSDIEKEVAKYSETTQKTHVRNKLNYLNKITIPRYIPDIDSNNYPVKINVNPNYIKKD